MVSKYVKAAGIDKERCCHLSGHSMATLMLEGGADIRYIQQMLAQGESCLFHPSGFCFRRSLETNVDFSTS